MNLKHFKHNKNSKTLSLLELIIVMAILGVLALGVVPFTQIQVISVKEEELEENLKTIRQAIVLYKEESKRKYISLLADYNATNNTSLATATLEIPPWQYLPQLPPGVLDLGILVLGTGTFIPASDTQLIGTGGASGTSVKGVLEKLPIDPFTGLADWRIFYYFDDTTTVGTYVFDVAPNRPANYNGPGGITSLGGLAYEDF